MNCIKLLSVGPVLLAVLASALLAQSVSGASLTLWNEPWNAVGGVSESGGVVTIANPGGAHRSFTPVAGRIACGADVRAEGCGFAGLALGRGDLSGNFWRNLDVLFYVTRGRLGLMIGGKDFSGKIADRSAAGDGFQRLEVLLDTVARRLTLVAGGKKVLSEMELPAGVKADAISSAGFRFNEPVSAGKPGVRNFSLKTENLVVGRLVLKDVRQAFVRPGEKSELRWQAGATGPSPKVPCRIVGYDGRIEKTCEARLGPDGAVTLDYVFPRGYHEVVFPEAGQSFGVVALEPFAGKPDPFFGMDGALSGLEQREEMRRALVAAVKRSGISVVRERLVLSGYDTQRRVCSWEGGWRPRAMRALYEQAGVETLEMLWGASTGLDPSPGGRMPYEYVALGDVWRDARVKIGASWRAYEVGNEPDLENFPADQYVSVVKGAARAQDPSLPHVPVVGGVLAHVPPGDWFNCARANGILDCSDAISFHQYDRVPSVEGQVAAMRDWMAGGGYPSKRLLLTESGHYWPLGTDRPDAAHDIDSAAEISAKAIEARACGVAEFHPFVLVFYEEGGVKNFGMFGREVTPTRQFAAYAFCILALAGREYAGDLKAGGLVRARVFTGSDVRAVASLYTGRPGQCVSVRLPGVANVVGADGRRISPSPDGTYGISDSLAYAFYKTPPSVDRATEAMRLYEVSRGVDKPLPPQPALVMQYRRDPRIGRESKRAYTFSKEEAKDIPVPVRLQNTGLQDVTAVLRLILPDGRKVSHPAVKVSARGSADVTMRVDVLGALDPCETRFVVVKADVDCGEQPLPLALPMTVDGEMDEILARFPVRTPVPFCETARWEMRAGNGRNSFSAKDGGVLRLDMDFDNIGTAWIYPYFRLPERINPADYCGIVLRARVEGPAGNVMTMLVDGKRGWEVWANDLFSADGRWHAVYIPFEGLHYHTVGMQNAPVDLARIDRVAVGCNSHEKKNALEVSGFYFVGNGFHSSTPVTGREVHDALHSAD